MRPDERAERRRQGKTGKKWAAEIDHEIACRDAIARRERFGWHILWMQTNGAGPKFRIGFVVRIYRPEPEFVRIYDPQFPNRYYSRLWCEVADCIESIDEADARGVIDDERFDAFKFPNRPV